MSSRSHHHRRRSHSASSPVPAPHHLTTETWRSTLKRARPTALHSPSYVNLASNQPPEKWDVNMWRRGKRARRSPSSSNGFTGASPLLTVDPSEQNPSTFTCSFPSSSAAFQFFPDRPNKSAHSSSRPVHMPNASPDDVTPIPADNVDQLRTDAFWELHRSIAESGEGFVSRMRDWESSQSRLTSQSHRRRASVAQHQRTRGRKSVPEPQAQSWSFDSPEHDSDEDDIQIISGESSSPDASPRGPPQKKRAFSLSVMDVDHSTVFEPYATPDSSVRCSSPLDTHFTGVSDDEEGSASPPPLTYAYTNSANSSLISLSLPPPYTSQSTLHESSVEHSPLCVPSTASRTEKAIAALSLAMANGAGGLSDYEALRMSENRISALDESLVGEMWH